MACTQTLVALGNQKCLSVPERLLPLRTKDRGKQVPDQSMAL